MGREKRKVDRKTDNLIKKKLIESSKMQRLDKKISWKKEKGRRRDNKRKKKEGKRNSQ